MPSDAWCCFPCLTVRLVDASHLRCGIKQEVVDLDNYAQRVPSVQFFSEEQLRGRSDPGQVVRHSSRSLLRLRRDHAQARAGGSELASRAGGS